MTTTNKQKRLLRQARLWSELTNDPEQKAILKSLILMVEVYATCTSIMLEALNRPEFSDLRILVQDILNADITREDK